MVASLFNHTRYNRTGGDDDNDNDDRMPYYTSNYYRHEDSNNEMYNTNGSNYNNNNNHIDFWKLQNLPSGAPTLWRRTWKHSDLARRLRESVGANTHKGRLLQIMSEMYHDYFNNGNVTIDLIQDNGRLPRNYLPPGSSPKSFKQLFRRSRHAPIKQSEIERAMQDVVMYVAHAPATSIQTAFRAYAARKKYGRQTVAATRIKAAFRGYTARQKYQRMREAHYAPGGLGAQQAFQHFAALSVRNSPRSASPTPRARGSGVARNTGQKDSRGRTIFQGPRGGLFVRNPDGTPMRLKKQ